MHTVNSIVRAFTVLGALVVPALAHAQDLPTSPSGANIPLRRVVNVVATDSGVLRTVSGVRHLSDGRVLVNDPLSRRMVILDPTLKKVDVIADTAAGARNVYTAVTGLIPYLGDTTLFVDRASTAFIAIEPDGTFGTVTSPPKVADMFYMAASSSGFDAKGRIVYRGYRMQDRTALMAMEMNAMAGNNQVMTTPDSAPILRADFDTRRVDTVAMLRVQVAKSGIQRMQSPTGGQMMISVPYFDPLPVTDEWTILPDGTIAIVRTRDYHIDWIDADGNVTSTPRMPFDWKRITLEDKQQIIDSVRKARADWDANNPPQAGPSMTLDGRTMAMPRAPFRTVEPEDLPDYYPPVRAGQVKADPDGNVWVLPATSTVTGAGLVYDVVNRKGEVFERVVLPAGMALAAVGAGGVIYMTPAVPTSAVPNPGGVAGGFRLVRGNVAR